MTRLSTVRKQVETAMADRGWLRVIDVAALDDGALHELVRAEMAHTCVLRLRNARSGADPLAFWRTVGEAVGRSSDLIEDSVTGLPTIVPGAWQDVRFEPGRSDTYRHHNVGQPLHSDGAYVPPAYAQEIVLFYLERQAQSGGESLFVDAATVAARAAATRPALLEALTTLPVHFGKAGAPGRTTTILASRDGRLKINWNYFRVLPGQGEAVDRLREDFREFLDQMIEDGAVASFRLEQGDALFFRDEEVLHGRRDFAAERSGDRLLWKTYFIPTAQAAEAA
jgi:alpha-ketoglutarate-dependent taurine dioxygenase